MEVRLGAIGRKDLCMANLVHWALAASTANSGAVNDEALLGLVSQATGLIRAGRPVQPDDTGQLAVLPAAHAEEKLEHIALLLLPELLNILWQITSDRKRRNATWRQIAHTL